MVNKMDFIQGIAGLYISRSIEGPNIGLLGAPVGRYGLSNYGTSITIPHMERFIRDIFLLLVSTGHA